MATTTEEIAIRLGIKNADLKAALADAGADVKKFKKAGESTSDDGLLGTIKKSTKALRDFREIFLGGALAGAVVGFFRLAIESAEKNTDATNENARAVRDFAASLSDAKVVAGNVAVAIVGFFNRVGEAIGDAVNKQIAMITGGREGLEILKKNTDAVVATGAAALEAEKRLADVRKKNGAEFLSITRELAAIEEKLRDQRLKGLTVYETEKNILKQLGDLHLKLRDYEGDAIGRRRLVLEVAKTQLAAEEATLAVKKDQVQVEKQIAEAAKKAEEERKKYQEEFEKAYEERLDKIEEYHKARDLGDREEYEYQLLKAKALTGLNSMELERLRILEKQKQMRGAEAEIQTLLTKENREGLTPADRARLVELDKQVKALERQLVVTRDLVIEENNLKAEIEAAANEMQIMNDEVERALQIEKSRSGTVKTTGDIRRLNTNQLDAVIQNITKQLGPIKSADALYHGPGTPVGTYKSVEQYMLQNQLDQAVAERNLRRDFETTLRNFGDSKTQTMFAPDDYNRLLQLFNPDQAKKDSQNIATIANGLQSLIPDKFNGAIR